MASDIFLCNGYKVVVGWSRIIEVGHIAFELVHGSSQHHISMV